MLNHTPGGVRRSIVLAATTLGLAAGSIALANPAAAGDTGTAITTVTPATIATTAVIGADRHAVYAGDTVHVVGKVAFDSFRRRIYRQPLTLQRLDATAWHSIAWVSTGNSGYATYTLRPSATARYRVSYAGSVTFKPSLSSEFTIAVNPITRAQRVLRTAAAQTGKWYSWGAAGPTSFDCSGLTLYAYRSVGVTLPHNANAQKSYGRVVSRAAALPGDLVIFLSGGYGYHAAIYAGGGYMYDAPHSGTTVGLHKIYSSEVVFRRLV